MTDAPDVLKHWPMTGRAQALGTARLVARLTHEIASGPLVTALAFLESLSADPFLPQDLRDMAQEAALRVAATAVHIEYLRDAFETDGWGLDGDGHVGPDLID